MQPFAAIPRWGGPYNKERYLVKVTTYLLPQPDNISISNGNLGKKKE
jgi:hypothetical protein